MPEYVVTSHKDYTGYRVTADSPRHAAEICAARSLYMEKPPALEEAPAPYPVEWIVIDVNGARLGNMMHVQAHRYRRSV